MGIERRLLEIAQTSVPTRGNHEGPFALISDEKRIDGLGSSFVYLRRNGGARSRLDVPRGTLKEDELHQGNLDFPTSTGAIATHASVLPKYSGNVLGCKVRFHDL